MSIALSTGQLTRGWEVNAEIKAKRKTVECGQAHFQTGQRRYTILDAPGHSNYVPSMISGTSQADVAVLVVSARNKQHAFLAMAMGVSRFVVAVNKMDSVGWDERIYEEIVSKARL